MPDPVTTIALAGQAAATIAKASLVDCIRDAAVDFLADQAKALGKDELSDRFKQLRSDAALREQIKAATERAVERWAQDYPDRDLVAAVATNTTFGDLPAVRDAVQTIAKRPFDPIATETLRGKFSQVLPAGFEPARIERGVIALLEMLREELAGVSALREALAVAAEIQTARATSQSVELLEALLRRIQQGPTATEKTLQDYLTWVVDQHRYLDPRGTMQTVRQVQVLLNDVYVSLQAEAEPAMGATDRRLFQHELDALLKRDDLRPEEREDLRENLQAQYTREATAQSGKPVELAGLVREHSKLVILGDPGAGKTTLLRYLALQNAQALRAGTATGLPAPTDARLPLYLRLANYAEHGNGRALGDFLPVCICGEEHADPALADLVKTRLAQGACLVLLDGLDEVIEPSQRAEIARQVDALIRAHERAGNRFVVASRVAGYRTAPLAGDIPHYRVCDMNDEQIRRFLEQWCRAVEHFQTPDLSVQAQNHKAQAEIDGISRAIADNPGVRRLAANPLLLRVLALIHRTGARLPQRRIELYRLAADTLIRDWELARGIPESALVREADANRLLAELAAWMHESKPAGIASEGEVREKLASVIGGLEDKEADHPDVQTAVSDFLSRIRQHTGLFVERAPRRFGFMHLTFQEYFAARWLVGRPREASRRIRNKVHRPRWEEPILLAIGFYGIEFPDGVSELVEEAILGEELGGASPYEKVLHRDLLFALRVLGDQDVNVALRRRIVSACIQLWKDEKGAGKYGTLQDQLAKTAQEIQSSVASKDLNAALLAALHDTQLAVRGFAARALASGTAQPDVIAALLAPLHDPEPSVRANAAHALGRAAAQPEVVASLLAALRDPDKGVRDNAALALSWVTVLTQVVTALLAALRDLESDVRSIAARTLCHATAQPGVVAALLAAMRDPEADVRGHAAFAFRNALLSAEVVHALLAALRDPELDVRSRAAYALVSATLSAEAITALLTVLRDPQSDLRRYAAYALGSVTEQHEVVQALLTCLRDPDAEVRRNATFALGNAAAEPHVATALFAAFHDPDPVVRRYAASALCRAATQPEVVAALLVSLRDPESDVRGGAASALGNAAAQPEVVTALLVALCDPEPDVRGDAASALGNAAAEPHVATALLAMLRDPEPYVRGNAAQALAQLARQASSRTLTELPQQLAIALELPGLDSTDWDKPFDSLFDALAAVAPGPVV